MKIRKSKPVTIVLKEAFVNDQLGIKLSAKSYVIDCRFEQAFETEVTTRVTTLFKERGMIRPVNDSRQPGPKPESLTDDTQLNLWI